MVVNNQEAKIHVGTKEAYITSTTSQSGTGTSVTSQTVNFVDTGITMSVTPTINRDGFISLKIKPEISEATYKDLFSEDQKTSVPIVTSSDAETTVMVKDGVTVIIGGLTKDKKDKTVKKIPLLGDIPALGFLFRSTSDNVTKSDLVILLTPHMMSGETSFSDFSEVKPKDGVVKKMVEGKIFEEKISPLTTGANKVYYDSIINKVRDLSLFSQPKGISGTVEASFILSSDGLLKSEPRIISSTNQKLNPVVLASIKGSAPFEPFPKGIKKDEINFKVSLDYK
jgi:Flp pilus assembly secretin CpaC